MRILLDIDGPCADFVGHLLERCGAHLPPSMVTEWNILNFLSPENTTRAKILLQDENFWAEIPVVPEALEGVERLERKHEVFFATSPWISCSTWEKTRRVWVAEYFRIPAYRIVFANDKGLLGGDVLIDDRPQNLENWREYNREGMAFLYSMPHNSRFSWPHRGGWPEIIQAFC